MYITSCNKNNQGSGFKSDTSSMTLNEKLHNIQSRSTSRPPVATRINNTEDEMTAVSSRFSELPRGKI
jgi:hypothetical protein